MLPVPAEEPLVIPEESAPATKKSVELKVLTVGELTLQIRLTLEDDFPKVAVEGEISNLRNQKSGHQYFTLKDDRAQLSCVLFRGRAVRGHPLKEGEAVRLHGNISVFEPRGNYQLMVDRVEPAGQGKLQAQFEALKAKLDAEGLFDPSKKKAIPKFPRCIGLVTSPTGAAIEDMTQILGRRAPWVKLVLSPVRVQGQGAAEEIRAGLTALLAWHEPIDIIIVGRGGGSVEDLWEFNDETLARAIAACPVPIISAVGHEIDFTISDFVADLRAATPSAAAELATPDGSELRARTQTTQQRMHRVVNQRLATAWQAYDHAAERFKGRTSRGLERLQNKLREAQARLKAAHPSQQLKARQHRLDDLRKRWQAAQPKLEPLRKEVAAQRERWKTALRRVLERKQQVCQHAQTRLDLLSPSNAMRRGYSILMGQQGGIIRSVRETREGDIIRAKIMDGEITATVDAIKKED